MKKLVCLFWLAFFVPNMSLAQTPVEKDNAGEVLYVYKGTIVYSNGKNTGRGSTEHPEWQCVDFVKRFYKNNYNMDLGSLGSNGVAGSASDAFAVWGKNPKFTAVPNGSSRRPQEDDILCFGGGTDGHVAIITSVSSNSVTIIDQNRARYKEGVFKDYTMTVSDGKYTIQKVSLNIQGWLTTKPAVIPDPPSTPALVGLMMPGAQAEPVITASFQNLYNGYGGQTAFGLPWNNNGHGIYVHDWGGLKVQDFLNGTSWCQFVWNQVAWQTYTVWNKILTFWNANWGYRDYGPPTGHEESAVYVGDVVAPSGSTIILQRFSLDGGSTIKTIVFWGGTIDAEAKHFPVGTIAIDVEVGYHAEIINKSTQKKIVLPTAVNQERQQYVVDSGLYQLCYYNQNGVKASCDEKDYPVSEGNHKYWQPSGVVDPDSGGSSGGGSSGGSSGGSGGSSGGGSSGGSGGGQISTLHLDDPHDGQMIFLADQTKRPFFITNIGHGILECTVSTSAHSWLVVKYATLGYYAENYVDTVFVNYGAMSNGTNIGHVYLHSNGGSATITVTANKTDSSPINPLNYNHNPAFTSFTVSPTSGSAPLTINCSATIQDQDNDPTTLIWDFGDGSTSSQLTISHLYSNSGQYTVKATASDGKGGSATREQQITVNEGAKLWANYDGLGFTRAYDISGSFVLGNSGNATLNWSMTDIPVWLSVNPISGIISVGKNDTVIVTPIDSKTPVGNSYADLKITSNGGDWNIHIIMNKPAPKLDFYWSIIDFDSVLVDKGYKIKNPGTDTLHWQLLEDIAWLSARPSSGSIAPNGKINVHFIANRSVLSSGGYSAKAYLNSNGGNKELLAKIFMPQPSTPKPTNH